MLPPCFVNFISLVGIFPLKYRANENLPPAVGLYPLLIFRAEGNLSGEKNGDVHHWQFKMEKNEPCIPQNLKVHGANELKNMKFGKEGGHDIAKYKSPPTQFYLPCTETMARFQRHNLK